MRGPGTGTLHARHYTRLQAPRAALVLHYDQSPVAVCEAMVGSGSGVSGFGWVQGLGFEVENRCWFEVEEGYW